MVHVLSHPDEAWEGERGHLNADLFRRHLPARYNYSQYFVCGPGPMMEATEAALTDIGVPADRVHTELVSIPSASLWSEGRILLRQMYTTRFVILTAVLLTLACFVWAVYVQ